MRITLCDGCGKKLDSIVEYASVNLGDGRIDLCYETCYSHYEGLVRSEEELADTIAEELAARRAELLDSFREALGRKYGPAEKH